MKACLLFAVVAVASSQEAAPGPLQQLVDGIFEHYLPAEQKGYVCPFKRIREQCELFNETVTEAKACHSTCEHGDFLCHLKCPKAKPTSVQELLKLSKAMLCHKSCGMDRPCHKTCTCPFREKHAACRKLGEVVDCYKKGGNHATCVLDTDAKELLLAEPWSLVRDVADHAVDFLLPPAEPVATEQEVHSCHHRCGYDGACHRACPKGQRGLLQEQCATLDAQKACHKACKAEEIKCPFKKMKCHMSCPSSMPASVEELKLMAEHMACHTECGKDEQCHKFCGILKQWTQRKERCAEYAKVASCHRNCGHSHHCHAFCPRMNFYENEMAPAANAPGSLAKEILDKIIV
eukprot:CAMPEP_0172667474 /NCGR_PEP_ID=MMETSP1074-20121228/8447_1 /TAXON_ID=2916 /ORGANISM="Ceratium fusus, Strain PA161109" /LENGTH=347 /DNA_ID=CAMNT_0013483983 /DNA_START=21 /DNA_END=1064 /DNA_ORIENTATION=-